jgi:hypothetical protein
MRNWIVMPSDDSLITGALEAMREPAEAFHSALARTVEDLRTFLGRHQGSRGDPEHLAAAELGAFGEGRVDATRFAALAAPTETVESNDLRHVERVLETLMTAEAKGADLLRTRVPRGESLRDGIAGALAETGRVFGVIRRVVPLLEGRGEVVNAGSLPHGYPFALWSRAERGVAPPLFVELDGADLNVAGLSEFLDGAQKIVLIVRGTAPPAPLAQLLSPSVMVMQTHEPSDLARVAAVPGPAIVALGSDSLLPFVHDPAGGACYAERLSVGDIPEIATARLADFRQAEDLAHLRELSTAHAGTIGSADTVTLVEAAVSPDADPVDRLAGWLLQQAGLIEGVG